MCRVVAGPVCVFMRMLLQLLLVVTIAVGGRSEGVRGRAFGPFLLVSSTSGVRGKRTRGKKK